EGVDQSGGQDGVTGVVDGLAHGLRGGGAGDGDRGDTTGLQVDVDVVDLGHRMHRLSDVACAVPAGHPCHLVDRGGARCFVVFLACVDGRGRGSRGGRSGRATPTAGGDQRQQGGSRGGHRNTPSGQWNQVVSHPPSYTPTGYWREGGGDLHREKDCGSS